MVFDTGTSLLPLDVDLANWQRLTGRNTTAGAPSRIEAHSFGQAQVISGAPSIDPVEIGGVPVGRQTVFTLQGSPESFAKDWGIKVDGIVGNAGLLDKIVVLDLTVTMRFGIIG